MISQRGKNCLKVSHSRGLQITLVNNPLDASYLPMLILHQLFGLLLVLILIFNPFLLGGSAFRLDNGNLLLLGIDRSILLDFFQDTSFSEILDGALSIDPTIEHPDKVVRAGEHEVDVVRDKDLPQR